MAMLFDLDGTLLDSAPDLIGSLNHVRESENLAKLDVEEFRCHASEGAAGLLKAGMPTTDESTFESWRLMFLEHYAENSYRDSALFDGIDEVLETLVNLGIRWGIVTNKPKALTGPIVKAAKLDRHASCIVCGDTLRTSKPDPAPVSLACRLLNVAPGQTLLVGDDIRDIRAGRAAGTLTAAVHYGYGSNLQQDPMVKDSFQIYHPLELITLVKGDCITP